MRSRWTWRLLSSPGVVWLSVFFLVAFYAVVAVAFGNEDTYSAPIPYWNPLDWNVGYVHAVLQNIWSGGQFLTVFLRTFEFVAIALGLLLLDDRYVRRWLPLWCAEPPLSVAPTASTGGRGKGIALGIFFCGIIYITGQLARG